MRYFITGSLIITLCLKLCLCFSHSEPLPGRSLTMKDGTGKLTLNITSFRSSSNIAWLIGQIPLSLSWQKKIRLLRMHGELFLEVVLNFVDSNRDSPPSPPPPPPPPLPPLSLSLPLPGSYFLSLSEVAKRLHTHPVLKAGDAEVKNIEQSVQPRDG